MGVTSSTSAFKWSTKIFQLLRRQATSPYWLVLWSRPVKQFGPIERGGGVQRLYLGAPHGCHHKSSEDSNIWSSDCHNFLKNLCSLTSVRNSEILELVELVELVSLTSYPRHSGLSLTSVLYLSSSIPPPSRPIAGNLKNPLRSPTHLKPSAVTPRVPHAVCQ